MPNKEKARLVVHGLASCDSCRKARKWLQSRELDHDFHDLRSDGLTDNQLEHWLGTEEGGKLLNKMSTTWRNLSAKEKDAAAHSLKTLLLAHPTLIKRPVITRGNKVLAIGFKPAELERALAP